MPTHPESFEAVFGGPLVMLAPLEDVSDVVFRRICRGFGAQVTVTEFVNVEGLLRGCRNAKRKISLAPDDALTAIQIYGSNPERLAEAASIAEASEPFFIDINCGCWVPKIAGRGAGAGWLRDPEKMVEMAAQIVRRVALPVTVKTRIGYGPESEMPIVDLARRLEDVGVRALTIHCRTAKMGHSGEADWSWAKKAREVVQMPVIVNGDVKSSTDAARALAQTGCEGVMIGRRAIEHPWVFREIRDKLERGLDRAAPTADERIDLCLHHLEKNVELRGPVYGVRVTRRHLAGYLSTLPGAAQLRKTLYLEGEHERCVDILEAARARYHRMSDSGWVGERVAHGSAGPARLAP